MRVLIAEDDPDIASGLCASLRRQGHVVDHVDNGAHADAALGSTQYALLVLDLGLPQLDGRDVLQRLRQRGDGLAVLVVTARDGLAERVRVLDLGADDYLVKPFALDEFEARVRAQLRRVTSNGTPDLRIGRLRLDLAGHRVWIDDQSLELTAREFGLLSALAVRAERIVSRAQLVEALCDWGQDLTDNGLDIALHRLRRKLQPGGMGIPGNSGRARRARRPRGGTGTPPLARCATVLAACRRALKHAAAHHPGAAHCGQRPAAPFVEDETMTADPGFTPGALPFAHFFTTGTAWA